MLNFRESESDRKNEYQVFNQLLDTKMNAFHKQIEMQIKAEVLWLKEKAEIIINDHRILEYQIRQCKSMSEWGVLEVKLRENKHSFSIDWFHNQFLKINGQWRKFSKPLRINRTTLSYSFKQAKKAKSWELEHAMFIEPKFTMIRKNMQKLIVLKRYV
ncbi:conjugative transfer protein MobI(A/C) [Thorsellia anophelis]|uniref:Uncharacterized protein n=1 Tax=Thorsellia anophelis DSM 18579 TaxID=1123402 RepID=A0A1I0F600_9GAMM|nr:conjugative transfer protein MobI(A/C) [Thorsellia anophelis]SET53278.1 hypothetical protein SAMN02583745_02649 [Thorsellia anophelis DSM 18579]